MRVKNFLITGAPGSGKTTLIKKLADGLRHLNPAGFYTSEIREGGVRRGFALASFDKNKDERGVLSHVDFKGPYRVGKYGVDVEGFETFISGLVLLSGDHGVIIIDEIGKMEAFSEKFASLVKDALGSGKPVVATVAKTGGGLITSVKRRPDIRMFELTIANREELKEEILKEVEKVTG